MPRKLKASEMVVGGCKFFGYLMRGGLLNINLEVTKRCNARCDFCDYWKEKAPSELGDYVPVVRKLKPLSVSLTGGEPLLRKDIAHVVKSLRRSFRFLHIHLITNAMLLTPERGEELWEAGLDELSISLDYPDERHDRDRHLPGLSAHIHSLVPLLRKRGVDLCFNVVIKRENYSEVPRIVQEAARVGVKVSLSTYNGWKVHNEEHMIRKNELVALESVVKELKRLKTILGNVTTSDYYMDRIPEFFARNGVPGCTAGLNWVQVTPDGKIKRCSDQPPVGDFNEWHRRTFRQTGCDRCWYSCRGAAQEPWTVKRFVEMAKDALGKSPQIPH
jgi:MoaA/NifB/PqqE/SkfB family radical SAM enzyme